MQCSCAYYLCQARLVSFSTRAPVQLPTTTSHEITWTRILSSITTRRTAATESRYSFYRTGRVNPEESERTTEINFCRERDSNPQPLIDRQAFKTHHTLKFHCEIGSDSRRCTRNLKFMMEIADDFRRCEICTLSNTIVMCMTVVSQALLHAADH